MAHQVGPVEMAFTLAGAPLADAEQAAQPRIGGAVGRVDQQRRAAGEVEPAADDDRKVDLASALVGAGDAGERVAVGDCECRQAERLRLRQQLLDMRGAAQKGVVRGDLQFSVKH